MMRTLMLSAVAATALVAANPALAQSTEADIKGVVEQFMADVSGGNAQASGMKWDGEVTVTAGSGEFYTAKLPALSVIDARGNGVEVGVIAMNIRPRDDGDYDMAIAMPNPMYVVKENERDAEMRIESQKLFARWSGEYGAMRSVNMDWSNFSIIGLKEDEQAVVNMGSISARMDNMPSGNLWNNTVALSLKDITADSPSGVRVFSLGNMGVNANTNNYDFPGLVKFKRKMQVIQSSLQDPATQQDPQAMPRLMGEMSALIKEAGPILGSDFTARLELNSMKGTDDSGDEGFAMDQVWLNYGMTGLTEETATANAKWLYRGLDISPKADIHKLLPNRSDGEFTVNAIPRKDLMDTALGSMDTIAAGQQFNPMVMLMLPGYFGKAGTSIDIPALNFGGDILALTSQGKFATSEELMKAGTMLAGELNGMVTGLDAAIAEAEASEDYEMQNALGQLRLMREVGNPVPGESDAYSFKFELTTDNQRLINGRDLDEVMSGGGAAEEAVPE